MIVSSLNFIRASIVLPVALLFLFVDAPVFNSQLKADTPDRCFHIHYSSGHTKCKKRIPGKKCNDGKGRKGKCVQGSSRCYCKLYPKKKKTLKKLLDLGVGVGSILLEKEHRDKYHEREERRGENFED